MKRDGREEFRLEGEQLLPPAGKGKPATRVQEALAMRVKMLRAKVQRYMELNALLNVRLAMMQPKELADYYQGF